MIPHKMLDMEMAAEKQRDIFLLQHMDQFLAVFNGTVIHIYLALLKQIMMGYRKKDHTVLPGLL